MKKVLYAIAAAIVMALAFLLAFLGSRNSHPTSGLTIIVGTSEGSAHDIYARLIAPYLGKYLDPSGQTVLVENLIGGNGLFAAAYLARTVPRDATILGALSMGVFMPSGGANAFGFDPNSLTAVGGAASGVRLCVVNATTGVSVLGDARGKRLKLGSMQYGSFGLYARLLNSLVRTDFDIVSGYSGTPEIFLAMDRREVDGVCGVEWTTVVAQRPQWLNDKAVNVIVAFAPRSGSVHLPGYSGQVDDVRAYVSAGDIEIIDWITSELGTTRSYFASSSTPKDRLESIRSAFQKALGDPSLIEKAKNIKLPIAFISAQQVQQTVDSIVNVSPEVLEHVTSAMHP
jgi:tripartite-type tricarboxylate transporter receptor subunit TctC